MNTLRASRALRAGRPMPEPVERAPSGTRQVQQLVQLYGEPNAETPLTTYADYARNAYGSSGYPGNSVVFSVIDRRMSVFSEAAFKWRRKSDKKLWGDERLAKLEKPWPGGQSGDLWARMEQDASLAGNAFIRDCGSRLERLRPDWVTIVSWVTEDDFGEEVREVLGYAFDPQGADPDRSPAFYPRGEVAHWAPTPDPLANFRGMSWLTPVVRELVGDIRMAEYREKFFTNAATPNLVIRYSTKLAPERVERLRTMLKARYTGSENAFGTLVLDEGADLTVVGQDMVGSAFDALQAAGETRVCMAGGVPAIVVGARQGLQASAIGEYQQALRAFADLKMRPNWRSACGALEQLVSVPPGCQLWFDVADVSALQQGEKDAADTSAQQAATIAALMMQGFTAESVVQAVVAGDMSLLKHTGAQSVQVQPGTTAQPTAAMPAPADEPTDQPTPEPVAA